MRGWEGGVEWAGSAPLGGASGAYGGRGIGGSGAAVTLDCAALHLAHRASPNGKIKVQMVLREGAPDNHLYFYFSALLIASMKNLCYTYSDIDFFIGWLFPLSCGW